jgi:ABC-type branched-subunit amino acid transport system substrate-binding protein
VPDAQEIRQRITAYVEFVNNSGGIKGRKFAYFAEDDTSCWTIPT